jgi:hypothetical protein
MCSCSPLRLLVCVLVSLGSVACAEPVDATGSEVESVAAEVDTDGSPIVQKKDHDGDGFTPREGDCDDANPSVYPGAPEDCDGVVNDCESAGPLLEWGTVRVDQGERFATLMEALEATPEGRVYELCYGVHELSIAIERDLSLIGVADPTSETYARPELRRSEPGTTLRVRGAAVVVTGVVVQAGTGTPTSAGTTLGGSVLVEQGAELRLDRSMVAGGRATYGGGIAVIRGTLLFAGVTVTDAQAEDHGGGMYVYEGFASLESVSFARCAAGGLGGGLAVAAGDVAFGSIAVEDAAAEIGAGVAVYDRGRVHGTSLRVTDAAASERGGGLAVIGAGSSFDAISVLLDHDTAAVAGGGLLVSEGAQVSVGGDLNGRYTPWGDSIGYLRLEDNAATSGGGAFVDVGSSLHVDGGRWSSNVASAAGGAVWVRGGTLSAVDLVVTGNGLTGAGGHADVLTPATAIQVSEQALVQLRGAQFASGAAAGPLVAVEDSEIDVEDVRLAGGRSQTGFSLRAGSMGRFVRTTRSADLGTAIVLEHSIGIDLDGVYEQSTARHPVAEVHDGASLSLHGTTIRRNYDASGGDAGAIAAFDGGLVAMIEVDLGDGAVDNHPADVVFGGVGVLGPSGTPALGVWSAGSPVNAICSGTSAGCATLP